MARSTDEEKRLTRSSTGFGLAQHDAIAVAVVGRAVSVLSVIVIGGIVYWSSRKELHGEVA